MSVDQVFEKLQLELENTRVVVAELESRIVATEEINQMIVEELHHRVRENDIENCTLVDADNVSDDCDFLLSPQASLLDETYNKIEMANGSPKLLINHEEEENTSIDRICNALQNLIKDAQLALLRAPSNYQFLDHSLGYRSRSTSFSSSIESWVLDQTISNQPGCDCESCWACLGRSQSGKQIARSSGDTITSDQNEGLDNRAAIHKTRPQLTSEYRKSCENLENEFQKFIFAAFSLDPKDQNASDNQNFESDREEVGRVFGDKKDIQCNTLDQFEDGLTTNNIPSEFENPVNKDHYRQFHAGRFSIYSSLRQKWVIFIGLIVGTAKMMMTSSIGNISIRSSMARGPLKKSRNSKIIISVIKYISVLVVGWSLGRASKGGDRSKNNMRTARPIAYTNIRI